MRRILSACAVALSFSIAVSAQDSTVKSKTKIKTDEASIYSMTGCLHRDVAGNFTLYGTAVAADDNLTTKNKVKTDNDRNKSKVTSTSETKADDGRVGTAGALSTFMLTPRDGVALTPHVGQQVQLSGIMVDPGHKDADVKIEDTTTVDPEHGNDHTARSKTKVEVDRGAFGHFTVVSVKPLGSPCR
jgi:hypothetical protein